MSKALSVEDVILEAPNLVKLKGSSELYAFVLANPIEAESTFRMLRTVIRNKDGIGAREKVEEMLRKSGTEARLSEDWILLPVISRSTTGQSTLMVVDAKWLTVEIKGWAHEISQKEPGTLFLNPGIQHAPLGSGLKRTGMRFESPFEEGGGLDLEIQFDEMVDVCGNDDTLMVVSREIGLNRSITVRSASGAQPPITVAYRLVSAPSALKYEQPNDEATDVMWLAPGEIFFLSERTRLTALAESVVRIPLSIFEEDATGSIMVGSVIHCDDGVEMWLPHGPSDTSLGNCIQLRLFPGNSVWLSRSSQAIVESPEGQNLCSMQFKLTSQKQK